MSLANWLEVVVVGHLLLGAAWIGVTITKKRSAAIRHAIWTMAFVLILFLPLIRLCGPAIAISAPVTPTEQSPVALATQATTITPADLSTISNPEPAAPKESPTPWKEILGGVWAAGAAVIIGNLMLAATYLTYVRRRKSRPSSVTTIALDRGSLGQRAGVNRFWDLRVCLGPTPPTAMTWGIKPPVVLLPEDSLAWPSERLEAVMLHELAHVRRWDSLTQFVAVLASAFYWFSPAPWLCARAMRAEAESAADQAVLGSGVTPSEYADMLIRIATTIARRRQPFAFIGVSIMNKSRIEKRVETVLSPNTRRAATIVELVVTCCAGLLVLGPIALLKVKDQPQDPTVAPPPPQISRSHQVAPRPRGRAPHAPEVSVNVSPPPQRGSAPAAPRTPRVLRQGQTLAPAAPEPQGIPRRLGRIQEEAPPVAPGSTSSPVLAPPAPDGLLEIQPPVAPSPQSRGDQRNTEEEIRQLQRQVEEIQERLRKLRSDLAGNRGIQTRELTARPTREGLIRVAPVRSAPLTIRGGNNPVQPTIAPVRTPLPTLRVGQRVNLALPRTVELKTVRDGRRVTVQADNPIITSRRTNGTIEVQALPSRPLTITSRLGGEQVKVESLELRRYLIANAAAGEIAKKLTELQLPGVKAIVVDERSNAIIVQGKQESMARVQREIAKLDKKA